MFELCRVEFSDDAIQFKDRTVVEDEAELQAFPERHRFAAFRPMQGDARPLPISRCKETWRPVPDPQDNRLWWFLAAPNRSRDGKFDTELYRSVGVLNTRWSDGSSLRVWIECAGLPPNAVPATIRDLTGDLVSIITSRDTPLEYSVEGGGGSRPRRFSEKHLAALAELAHRLETLLAHSGTKLVIENLPLPAHRVKPTPTNLLRRLRRPEANALWAQTVKEHLDTGENRFMHATALRALRIVNAAIEVEQQTPNPEAVYLNALDGLRRRYTRIIGLFREKRIGTDRTHYNRIVMQRSRRYAAAYSLQKALFAELNVWSEIAEILGETRNIRVSHLSQIYERWCLVKIIRTLMECYRFHPVGDWQKAFVRDVCLDKHNVALRMHHPEYGFDIRLTYEHELERNPLDGKIYRPDFVLELLDTGFPKLVLDAKFRTRLGREGCEELHKALHQGKSYGEGGRNLVFIVHPAGSRAACYDVLHWTGGWVYALAGQGENYSPRDGIRLAILQWLQYVESFDQDNPGLKLCPNCARGGSFLREERTSAATKKMTCTHCGQIRLWTRCFGCGHKPLIKNPGRNYFRTQGSECNVVCPRCSASF